MNCSLVKEGLLYDNSCSTKSCFVCAWKNNPVFYLRGLCDNTRVYEKYVLLPDYVYDDHVYFYGLRYNNILFSKEKNSWLIVEDYTSVLFQPNGTTTRPTKIVGSFKPDTFSHQMSFGNQLWNLTGDECGDTRRLKFTSVRLNSLW